MLLAHMELNILFILMPIEVRNISIKIIEFTKISYR